MNKSIILLWIVGIYCCRSLSMQEEYQEEAPITPRTRATVIEITGQSPRHFMIGSPILRLLGTTPKTPLISPRRERTNSGIELRGSGSFYLSDDSSLLHDEISTREGTGYDEFGSSGTEYSQGAFDESILWASLTGDERTIAMIAANIKRIMKIDPSIVLPHEELDNYMHDVKKQGEGEFEDLYGLLLAQALNDKHKKKQIKMCQKILKATTDQYIQNQNTRIKRQKRYKNCSLGCIVLQGIGMAGVLAAMFHYAWSPCFDY